MGRQLPSPPEHGTPPPEYNKVARKAVGAGKNINDASRVIGPPDDAQHRRASDQRRMRQAGGRRAASIPPATSGLSLPSIPSSHQSTAEGSTQRRQRFQEAFVESRSGSQSDGDDDTEDLLYGLVDIDDDAEIPFSPGSHGTRRLGTRRPVQAADGGGRRDVRISEDSRSPDPKSQALVCQQVLLPPSPAANKRNSSVKSQDFMPRDKGRSDRVAADSAKYKPKEQNRSIPTRPDHWASVRRTANDGRHGGANFRTKEPTPYNGTKLSTGDFECPDCGHVWRGKTFSHCEQECHLCGTRVIPYRMFPILQHHGQRQRHPRGGERRGGGGPGRGYRGAMSRHLTQ